MRPGLYLHLPFCSAICPYCDFAVTVGGGERRRSFVDGLLREMELWRKAARERFGGSSFDTLYLGGGTPSLLEPEDLARILSAAQRWLPLAPARDAYLEANPEDVTPARLAAWRAAGVSGVSLGVQSFAEESLRFLGRRHTAAEGRRAVEWTLEAGFSWVSFDLIYGLPGQTPEAWRRELAVAASLGAPHLSCYQLTVHEGTPFGAWRVRGRLVELPEEEQADLFLLAHRVLAERGLCGYEASNFARSPEARSRHNAKYWHHVPYLGLGPSAHSFDGGSRWWNRRRLEDWRAAVDGGRLPVEEEERLRPEQLALEALLLGLRTRDGLDVAEVEARTGVALSTPNRRLIEELVAGRLLQVEGSRLRPTLAGMAVADGVAARFSLGAV